MAMWDNELEYYGIDLYETLEELGENVTFDMPDGTQIKCKISLDNKVAKSEITAINEYAFNGSMTFPSKEYIETLKGMYLKRELYPDKTYILLITSELPFDERIANVYVAECNDVIDIAYTTTEVDEFFNNVVITHKIYENVPAYSAVNTKTQQITDVGTLPKNVIDIYLPASLEVTTYHKVVKREYQTIPAKDKTIPITLMGEQRYSIENTDYTLANILSPEKVYGVLKLEVMKEV